MKPNLTAPGKVIITVAPTGGLHGKEANPALPEQPAEIVQAFRDCYNAGASIAHMHVRDKQGLTTSDLNVYSEVIAGVCANCRSVSTGSRRARHRGSTAGPSITRCCRNSRATTLPRCSPFWGLRTSIRNRCLAI